MPWPEGCHLITSDIAALALAVRVCSAWMGVAERPASCLAAAAPDLQLQAVAASTCGANTSFFK